MGTEKKSKSGSELPKGSAAPSCNPRLCACPGRCYFRGAASKGVLSSPRAGRCLVGVTEVPITPGATSPPASIGSGSCGGSCTKSWHPGAPFPAWQGGRGRQPGRDGGTQLALPCLALLLWRRPRQSGTPSRGVGRRTKPSGHGDTRGHLSPARLLGLGGLGGSLGRGLHVPGPGSLRPALGQGVLSVPRRGQERFQGAAGWPHRAPTWLQPH